MTLYIQPNQTVFPTADVLTAEAIQYMTWLGFSSETTNEQLVAAGLISVTEPDGAQPDNTTLVVDKNQNNEYYAQWMPNSDYEQILDDRKSAGGVRRYRNILLQQSDWTQSKDIPDNVSSAWTSYRQALRDITTQAGFPTNVTWPVKPN